MNSQVNDIGLGQPLTAQVRLVGSEWAATWRCLLRHSGLSAQVTKYVIVFPGDKLYTVVAFMHAKTIKSLMLNIKWANRARILRCIILINNSFLALHNCSFLENICITVTVHLNDLYSHSCGMNVENLL